MMMIDIAIGITKSARWKMLGFTTLHAAIAGIVSGDRPIPTSTDIRNVKSHMEPIVITVTLVVIIRLYLNGSATWMNRSICSLE